MSEYSFETDLGLLFLTMGKASTLYIFALRFYLGCTDKSVNQFIGAADFF